jgi:hypothetical protein
VLRPASGLARFDPIGGDGGIRSTVDGVSCEPSRSDGRRDADSGPLDPFLGDPDDPAALLDSIEPIAPLSADERCDVRADLAELTEFRSVLDPVGVRGIIVECGDCGEQHYFGWELMAANLRALLGEGRTHVHEPAFAPDPDAYVSWDYARGYADAVTAASKRF